VLVAVNLSKQPVELQLQAINGQLPVQAEQYETSEQFDLALVGSGPVQGSWPLAPLSVTTLVLDR
jgi:hypothetical protein